MGFSVTHLLVVLAIVVVVFGTKRLRHLGADLGEAIKSFRTAVREGEEDSNAEDKGLKAGAIADARTIAEEQVKVNPPA